MRAGERDLLLLVLAVSAGSADGWSYFGIGHAFVANMTGNTVLLGVSLSGYAHDSLHPAIAILCYAAGAVFASFLARNVRQGAVWPRTISAILLLESVLLAGSEIAWIQIVRISPGNHAEILHGHNLLLGIVGFSIGIQSGAMLQLKIPGVVTTYITGTWTTLMSGLARLLSGKPSGPARQKLAFEERLLLQAGILAVYFLAALLTGWTLQTLPAAVGAIPAASVLGVAGFGLVRGGHAEA
jgi:uncharacterized membrane protein YoaK (UPF0700 family)